MRNSRKIILLLTEHEPHEWKVVFVQKYCNGIHMLNVMFDI